MRPDLLAPLFADVTTLQGVGPKTAALMSKVAGGRVLDLALLLPSGLIDRTYRPKIAEAEEGRMATFEVRVERHNPNPAHRKSAPYKVLCSDETGFLTLVFFRPNRDWLMRQLPEGENVVVSGKVELYAGERQITHPDHIAHGESADDIPDYEPVYPLTAGLAAGTMKKAVGAAVEKLPTLPEWHDLTLPQLEALPPFSEAVRRCHHPDSPLSLRPDNVARKRLAYDELLANQLALALIRQQRRARPGRALYGDGELIAAARAALPFDLTGDQQAVLGEIHADMASTDRMVRLVQGDVGSGKTVVALLALLRAVEAGVQGALMCPTEILAQQHFAFIEPICDQLGLSCALVLGRDKGQERKAIRSGIEKGYVSIAIGTHALFSEDVTYHDLGLVIVDEQHRFGVNQRLALQEKGRRTDLLVMTATPIPRTLALAGFGDMDISAIREKPPGRKPILTRAIPKARLDEVVEGVARALGRDEQAYWVCPLVEESEVGSELTAATDRALALKERFGDAVGLVHGQMPPTEKDAIVDAFTRGEKKILVATTVIEVGVNTPNATIIVIEHAERFGLAQLHQLRGRVGRGEKQAACILLYDQGDGGLGETTKARLNILRETEDGFLIAEEDLRLRGAGDALGTAQSGLPAFRVADIADHASLLQLADDEARLIAAQDPKLEGARGAALRCLLYLFDRDDAVKRLRSG